MQMHTENLCIVFGLEKVQNQAKWHLTSFEDKRKKNERTILQHFWQVSGAYKYMLSYASNKMKKTDWLNYGFE